MNERTHRLPRPPETAALQEPPAMVEPRLRGMPPPPQGEIEQWETVASEMQQPRSLQESIGAATEAARAHDEVRALLEGGRTGVLGYSELQDEKGVERPATVLHAYDYERGRALEVRLEGDPGDLRVRSFEEIDRQPPLSDDEIQRAIRVARDADRVARHLSDDWTANALLTSDVSPGDRHYGTRRAVVVLGPADERLPRVRVLVDLATDAVIGVDTRDDTLEEEGHE